MVESILRKRFVLVPIIVHFFLSPPKTGTQNNVIVKHHAAIHHILRET